MVLQSHVLKKTTPKPPFATMSRGSPLDPHRGLNVTYHPTEKLL